MGSMHRLEAVNLEPATVEQVRSSEGGDEATLLPRHPETRGTFYRAARRNRANIGNSRGAVDKQQALPFLMPENLASQMLQARIPKAKARFEAVARLPLRAAKQSGLAGCSQESGEARADMSRRGTRRGRGAVRVA